ncbi:riboflavin biosynthesis protein [Flexivirga endophytica]|uniref:Riboflavin biosynthesis protein n=1 Tax=Flexivirga endophytica TaxID=1849103 RepID=A0A916TFD1_9MICO|nr:bifunctional riboflavin kinase/FAD synthetase [Flexivirga endophytica]GGB40438.1 riboflavin biosynthesis protein [Flexivirga endophytica]GHB48270.1 riboflavin biosynthesis protein [Flexivirga endophytica]
MLRLSKLTEIPADFGECVVTIGNFDGVHRGHAALLHQVVERARARGVRSCAVTFDPHPLQVLHPERAPHLIASSATRFARLAETGLDAVLVLDFTPELAAMTPEEFVRDVFVNGLHVAEAVVGGDTRFGAKNAGDVSTLRQLGKQYDFTVDVMPDVGEGHRISSTDVRSALAEGAVDRAARALGHLHDVRGVVVRGLQRGRELGFPTANLGPKPEGLVPADGVYVGWLVREGVALDDPEYRMPAAISVGTNPTFDDVPERTVEAYVLDRDDLDLYDETIRIEFVRRLRGNTKFTSIDALIAQMHRDVDQAREICRTQ